MLKGVFTVSTMTFASFCLILGIPTARRKNILLSKLVEFLTGFENVLAPVLSCANRRPTVVVRICLLTMCHVCTCEADTPAATTVVMLWTARTGKGVILADCNTDVEWSGYVMVY